MAECVPSRITCAQATALLLDYITGALDPVTTLGLERSSVTVRVWFHRLSTSLKMDGYSSR